MNYYLLIRIYVFVNVSRETFQYVFRFCLKNDVNTYKVLFLLRALCYNEMKYF